MKGAAWVGEGGVPERRWVVGWGQNNTWKGVAAPLPTFYCPSSPLEAQPSPAQDCLPGSGSEIAGKELSRPILVGLSSGKGTNVPLYGGTSI